MRLNLATSDELVPSVSPKGGNPARTAATTQLEIRVAGWHDNLFRMWAPEHVGAVWTHNDPAHAHQEFASIDGGVRWHHCADSGASVELIAPLQSQVLLAGSNTKVSL